MFPRQGAVAPSSRINTCLIRSQDTAASVGSNWTKSWFVASPETDGTRADGAPGISDELAGMAARRHKVGVAGWAPATPRQAPRRTATATARTARRLPVALTFMFIRHRTVTGTDAQRAGAGAGVNIQASPSPAKALAGLSAGLAGAGLLSPLAAGFPAAADELAGAASFLAASLYFSLR